MMSRIMFILTYLFFALVLIVKHIKKGRCYHVKIISQLLFMMSLNILHLEKWEILKLFKKEDSIRNIYTKINNT